MPDPSHAATWRFALPHTTAAVPLARALIRNTLADIGAPVDGDTAELLTAELVANAVRHTDGDEPIELVVELVPTGGWQVEVHDQDPNPPGGLDSLGRPEGPKRPDGLAEGGRGLLLIRTLSADAGYRPTPYGKAVWFILPPTGSPAGGPTEGLADGPTEGLADGPAEPAAEGPTER
ncbi:ATP-binding protein [Stenotrophomonas sp. NPDC087984]